jgi:hypothetical protein
VTGAAVIATSRTGTPSRRRRASAWPTALADGPTTPVGGLLAGAGADAEQQHTAEALAAAESAPAHPHADPPATPAGRVS